MTDVMWTTQDGQTIPIRWMTSPHLVHSFNLLARRNKITFANVKLTATKDKTGTVQAMIDEMTARQLYSWRPDDQLDTTSLPARESRLQLCLMRAMWDTGTWPGILWPQDYLQWLRRDAEGLLEQFERDKPNDEKTRTVLAKFVEYRLSNDGL